MPVFIYQTTQPTAQQLTYDIKGTYDSIKDLFNSLKEQYQDVTVIKYNTHLLKIEVNGAICYAKYEYNKGIEITSVTVMKN